MERERSRGPRFLAKCSYISDHSQPKQIMRNNCCFKPLHFEAVVMQQEVTDSTVFFHLLYSYQTSISSLLYENKIPTIFFHQNSITPSDEADVNFKYIDFHLLPPSRICWELRGSLQVCSLQSANISFLFQEFIFGSYFTCFTHFQSLYHCTFIFNSVCVYFQGFCQL